MQTFISSILDIIISFVGSDGFISSAFGFLPIFALICAVISLFRYLLRSF